MPVAPWGLMLPNFNPFGLETMPLLSSARQAEDAGFDAVWVGDHLAFHPPILEATMALSAAAAVTERVKLGFAVLLAPMRQPVWLAKSLQTLHHLAPGRLVAGFGVGGEHPPEWRAAGAQLADRGRRLDEFLDVLPCLLAGEAVDHAGALEVHTTGLQPAMA
ncbi:MAG: LLM class flavin-dependent oxidoreductase, partial [Actinomycetota bacterium]|nr:LLM class flavin-dependent oxidoreductase [Actinomycetota bacterium]